MKKEISITIIIGVITCCLHSCKKQANTSHNNSGNNTTGVHDTLPSNSRFFGKIKEIQAWGHGDSTHILNTIDFLYDNSERVTRIYWPGQIFEIDFSYPSDFKIVRKRIQDLSGNALTDTIFLNTNHDAVKIKNGNNIYVEWVYSGSLPLFRISHNDAYTDQYGTYHTASIDTAKYSYDLNGNPNNGTLIYNLSENAQSASPSIISDIINGDFPMPCKNLVSYDLVGGQDTVMAWSYKFDSQHRIISSTGRNIYLGFKPGGSYYTY